MIIQEVKMKKGLVVVIILSLALMASSCIPDEGSMINLSASDHTDIMGGVTKNLNSIEITSLMDITILTTPTVEELLNAALEAPAVSNSTKTSIQHVLDLLPELEGWLAEIPDETWQAIDDIMYDTEAFGGNITLTINYLQGGLNSNAWDDYEYLPEALEFGIDLLEAGEDTIYNPTWYPYAAEPLLSFNTSQMMKEDLEGGIAGAIGAALADIAPAQYVISIGGVVGAVDSSIADIIGQLTDWW
jgi:hypothetical protein